PYWVDIHVLDPFLGTGIENKQSDIVLRAFPNPFTNSTTIEYQVKVHSKVSLKIYDFYGKEVKTLVNSYQTLGTKNIIWDGTNNSVQVVPAGVYYCRIQAGNDSQCRKIIFTKS
ncbi:MAG: T9SS type A sorting domain-containing protein, partial [Bacteroidales bacterium]|nr:T9SS type A sorting domain-containing protein [Bacteroidales bacterium]